MEREYIARINRVIDHVQENVAGDLRLETLAAVARLSPYHFHRVFKALTGESLGQFVRRVRLERAAGQLCLAPHRSVTEIALDAGFSSPATFARAFRERFGMSATNWRDQSESKIRKSMSKDGNAPSGLQMYFESGAWAPKWRLTMTTTEKKDINVEIRELPEKTVAYIRHRGPYQGNQELFGRLFGQLAQWAGARGLLGPNAQFLSIYHDDPAITDEEKLQVMVCCTVQPETEVDGEVGKTVVPGGLYGVGHFEISGEDYGSAWDAMYGGWLPSSGYQPDERPSFEMYLNDPNSHPEKKHIVEICVPVKPM